MTWKDRYRTDRILNKLHQTFTSLPIKFTRPDASGFLLSPEFRPGAQGTLRNVLAFHNKEQFKGESTGIKRMQEKKKKSLVSGNKLWGLLGFLFFRPHDLGDSVSLVLARWN